MNILATSDLHGNISTYKKLAYQAKNPDIDIIIIAGDLSSFSANNDEEIVKSIFFPLKKPVLFIMGNDDEYEWKSENNITNINQKKFTFHDIEFVGYQYTNPFVGGEFEKTEKEQEVNFGKLSKIITTETILVTHGPCYQILDKTSTGYNVGSKALNNLCKSANPKYHLFGHIHEDFGSRDNHFNIAYPIAKKFLILNLKTSSFDYIKP